MECFPRHKPPRLIYIVPRYGSKSAGRKRRQDRTDQTERWKGDQRELAGIWSAHEFGTRIIWGDFGRWQNKLARYNSCPGRQRGHHFASTKKLDEYWIIVSELNYERNFIDGKDGSQEDPHEMQTLRSSLLSSSVQEMLLLRIWLNNKVTNLLLDDALSWLDSLRQKE